MAIAVIIWMSSVATADIHTMSVSGVDGWDSCLYDKNIDTGSDPGAAKLLKTDLIADETGNITGQTRELVTSYLRAKKELIIENPEADAATLLLYTNTAPGSAFILEVNDTVTTVTFDRERMLTGGWARADIDPKLLRKGLNTFVIYPPQANTMYLYVENGILPNRSARSFDAGETWDYDHLGEGGFCNGEYLIRLRLAHYPAAGEILSDYIPVGDLITKEGIKPMFELNGLELDIDADTPGGTSIDLFLRGGYTPSFDPTTWDPWLPAGEYRSLEDTEHDWKFVQWKAVLRTKNAQRTPVLRGVTVKADIETNSSQGGSLSADMSDNRDIIRGYYNFSYQPFDDERLQQLRKYFRLDEVVGGCSTEFEKFEVLATWVRGQWRDGWYGERTKGLKTPWDAWVALNLNDDFKASGMCTIYANVFVQCALAVGLNARGTILDHHFVSEIWSNDYEKWICFDIGFNSHSLRTVHMELDGDPLNSVEILQTVNDGKIADIDLATPPLWRQSWKGDQASEAKLTDPKNWRARTGIPFRNNYMESWLPGELQHGFHSYSYDGYLWWKKTLIPEYEEYTFQTDHKRDLYWSINQVEIFLSETETPGELKVICDTVTPNLDTLMRKTGNGEWKATPPVFTWKLERGENKLAVKPVNKWSLDGITSEITVRY